MLISFFQIEKFADRLESLKDELRDDFGEWEDVEREEVKVAGLGSMEDLRQLCEEAQEMEEGVQDIVKATKVGMMQQQLLYNMYGRLLLTLLFHLPLESLSLQYKILVVFRMLNAYNICVAVPGRNLNIIPLCISTALPCSKRHRAELPLRAGLIRTMHIHVDLSGINAASLCVWALPLTKVLRYGASNAVTRLNYTTE